ncbi:MAG: hypothetical protein Edafosvirus14_5 [Edafosvirus sp.]|uniref:Uncharacterized protein n=1 Tax=Edafosvirus sp. TaxID=2487765 RepID=A0A3G4ZU81_9VIRU|nr:MAG: hypothetical protein Edafosvirus14_5 [Edafosvirus sp.]
MDRNQIYLVCHYIEGSIFDINNLKPCYNLSNKKNGYCDEHNDATYVNNIDYFKPLEKKLCIRKIKELLHLSTITKGMLEKAKIANRIFEFLSKHKKFLCDYKKFEHVVLLKLLEFEEDFKTNDKIIQLEIYKYFDPMRYQKDLFPHMYDADYVPISLEINKELNENDKEIEKPIKIKSKVVRSVEI